MTNNGPAHLKAWREFLKLSQAELAERVGTTASMISMLETEQRGLSEKWLRRLADALGTTAGFLLDHDPNNLPPDLLDIWGKADDRQKRQIVDIAKALVRTGTDG